ncbi:MAG: T9SS type A sorting domain-containing protein [Bacteroidetes bacterium]|nr:T9SS type A sorting domain-containing protein [Bacteroidota bacterium]MCL1969581.1 T9SS type A sorting domain-containing protein [Bacteroidota bacterium]
MFDVFGKNAESLILMDISDLHSGIYFVKITTEQGSSVQRFVKE